MSILIRPEAPADVEGIREVHRQAFGQPDESKLVDDLRAGGYTRVSLVAEMNGVVVGHVVFSDLPIVSETGTTAALSLAPLAVLPQFQRQGIGQALTRDGLAACRDQGHRIVIVLGHPDFYPRFGFSAKLAAPLGTPFPGDSFMALELVPGAMENVTGRVCYTPPFGAFL